MKHTETYIGDVLQDNDGFLASFMSTYDKSNYSEFDLVAISECYGQVPKRVNVVQTVEDKYVVEYCFMSFMIFMKHCQ